MLTLNSQIGKGGFGVVYSGNLQGKGLVAVKVLSLLKEDRGRLRKYLPNLFECVLLSSFRHPYLATALQILTTDTKVMIIQDLATNDLDRWRRSNLPTDEQLLKWTGEITSAIRLLHRYSILHGDIKLSNILLYSNGSVRLADFTLARSLKEGWGCRLTPCAPNYRPLEVFLQRTFTLEIDLWALGCTLFELIYNYSLFPLQESPGGYINNLIKWSKSDKISYRTVDYSIYILPEQWDPIKRMMDSIILNLLKEEGSRVLPPGSIGKYSVLKSEEVIKDEKIKRCILSHLGLNQDEPCPYFEEELKVCEQMGFRLINFTS